MVIIRLARSGAKKNPYYFVTVADERKPRDGSFIERLGFFNPSARGQEERLRIDIEKLDQWVSKGAQLSDRVKKLVKDAKLSPEELQAKLDAKKQKAEEKKALAEKAAKEAESQRLAKEAAERKVAAEAKKKKEAEAKKKAELELSGQKSDIDFARVSADLQEQAAMLRTIQKVRNKKH